MVGTKSGDGWRNVGSGLVECWVMVGAMLGDGWHKLDDGWHNVG